MCSNLLPSFLFCLSPCADDLQENRGRQERPLPEEHPQAGAGLGLLREEGEAAREQLRHRLLRLCGHRLL